MLEQQIELEKLYDKNQTMRRLKTYFKDELTTLGGPDLTAFFKQADISETFGFALVAQMALHRRTNVPTLVGLMRPHFETGQDTADALHKAVQLGLMNWDPAFEQFIVIPELCVPPYVQRDLDMFQFPLPMVVEPKEVKTNRQTGYITSSGSIILKQNHHDDDVCLDHINRMNRIKLTLNVDTANMIANSWRNLDKPKEGETDSEFEMRKRAFEKYDRTARDVITIIEGLGNQFHLTHKYDKRGRIYCQGYHISYQGNAWNKSVIELADKEVIL